MVKIKKGAKPEAGAKGAGGDAKLNKKPVAQSPKTKSGPIQKNKKQNGNQQANSKASKPKPKMGDKGTKLQDLQPAEKLKYLTSWDKHDGSWKFDKQTHIWLRRNMLHKKRLPNEFFEKFLRYAKEHVEVSSRDVISIAKGIVKKGDPDKDVLKRAEQVIAALE